MWIIDGEAVYTALVASWTLNDDGTTFRNGHYVRWERVTL